MTAATTTGWLAASVRSARRPTAAGRILELDVADWTGSLAGQHIDVRLTAEDGYQAVRSYSLASFGDSGVEIAVVELADGEVSPYLVETVEPGDQLEVRGPIGGYFVWRPADPTPVQLIGGGSGIVPLVAIARAHATHASHMRLLYSVRSPEDALYIDELRALEDDTFTMDVFYTRRAPAGSAREPHRVETSELVAHTLSPVLAPRTYICGPTAFVEAIADTLVTAGHSAGSVLTERFGGA